jgi:glucose/arabinose dehydrogenase
MRTLRVLTAATCLISLSLAAAPSARAEQIATPATSSAIKVVPVKTGLNGPSAFTFSPAGRIWYLERGTGEVRILNRKTKHERLFFHIGGVDGSGERGALGIALHPDWPSTPFVYVYVTRSDHGVLVNELLRIRSRNGRGVGFRVLFRWKVSSATNHNGGRILFGPDGKLYIVTGENADPANSQDKTNLRGKILRINPDGSIPSSNPFGTRIWSYGHRNSFGFTFDPKTHRLWETENGPECNDEINLIVKGANFGWGPNENCSGTAPQDTNNSGPKPRHLPKTYFAGTIGITGAAFCISCGLGAGLAGDLIFGDVNTSSIRAIGMNAARSGFSAGSRRVLLTTSTGGVHSIEVGPKHRIYFSGPNGIYRLAAA